MTQQTGDIPFWTTVSSSIARADAANSMMYKVTADTTFKVYNVNAITDTSVNGDGVFISADDIMQVEQLTLFVELTITSSKSCILG